jgi:SsrA-binding protein
MKVLATNKKAYHEYTVIETLEVGINLIGCEVKSVKNSEMNLLDSYCRIENGQLLLIGCYIKNYDKGSFSNVDDRRDRRLLAHRREIDRILGKVKEKGYSIVPLKVLLDRSLIKLEIALVVGKKLYDKRDAIAKRDQARATERAISDYGKK